MSEIGIHQGDYGLKNFQSCPPSHGPGEIDSDEEERRMEPQVEDVFNSSGLRNRKMKFSRPDEDGHYPSESGNGKEKSSLPGREADGGVEQSLLRFSIDFVTDFLLSFPKKLSTRFIWVGIHSLLFLLLVLFSRSSSGELYVNQHEVSKDPHQKISEMRIVETPLHSVRSAAQDETRVLKMARHDSLLLRTAGDKWYKAEKRGPSSGQAGIHFYAVTGPGVEVIRFRSSISVDISLAQALDILTNHKLHNNLFEENCWKYAHSRAEAILKSCIEIASDDNVRSGLKKELENLMDARRRMPNEVVDFVQVCNVSCGYLLLLTGLCFHPSTVFGMVLDSRLSFGVELWTFFGMSSILPLFVDSRDPSLSTYNLTWLATAYGWPFRLLYFSGYYFGWAVFWIGMEDCLCELRMHYDDCVSKRSGQYRLRQGKSWPYRTLGFFFRIYNFVQEVQDLFHHSFLVILDHCVCKLKLWLTDEE